MSDLIARLEAATEGSEGLDAMIWWRVEPRSAKCAYWNASTGLPRELADTMPTSGLGYLALKCHAPKYSRSLDAAMTLVPEGCDVDLQTRKRYCSIYRWDNSRGYGVPLGSDCGAATPILALVIAALKAREATND